MEADLENRSRRRRTRDEGAEDLMRCDLHVLKHIGRECYSEPGALYEQARRRGMDLFALLG